MSFFTPKTVRLQTEVSLLKKEIEILQGVILPGERNIVLQIDEETGLIPKQVIEEWVDVRVRQQMKEMEQRLATMATTAAAEVQKLRGALITLLRETA